MSNGRSSRTFSVSASAAIAASPSGPLPASRRIATVSA